MMRLTTKGRFAVTAMLDLALQKNIAPTPLSDISQRQQISLSYLEQLFGKLRQAGLVQSVRGSQGGYRLARQSKDISLAAIVNAVDEKIDSTHCRGEKNCHGLDKPCIAHDLWTSVNQLIGDYFSAIYLADLANHQPKSGSKKPSKKLLSLQPITFIRSEPCNEK